MVDIYKNGPDCRYGFKVDPFFSQKLERNVRKNEVQETLRFECPIES